MPEKTFLLILNMMLSLFAAGQNLVKNGSFEDHLLLDCQVCHYGDDNFATTLKNWRNLNSQVNICDCNYRKSPSETESRHCPFDKVQPYSGCSMLELWYSPNCLDWQHKTRGCSSYVGTTLAAPLELGKIYEVSCKLYILPPDDPEYLRHIGFSLYPGVFRNPDGGMLEGTNFLPDTVIYEKWQEVKWHVRPLCRLQFLVFGVFRGKDGPPVHSFSHENIFYLDEINVREVDIADENDIIPTPFCRYLQTETQNLQPEIKGADCYFEIADSTLSAEAFSVLDSFAMRAKANPNVAFIISGHTDITGENHLSLSATRMEKVLNYLEEKHQLPKMRFVAYAAGSSEPEASNGTKEGRQLNRRVSIRQTDAGIAKVIYRNLLSAVFNNEKTEAYKAAQIWLRLADDKYKIMMIYDPRLAILKEDIRWETIFQPIKNSYKKFPNPDKAWRLDSLWAEDQRTRTLPYFIENLNAWYARIDSTEKRWDVRFMEAINNNYSQDSLHFLALTNILGKNEWPGISEVGERAAKAAFLIINHQKDTAIFNRFLPLLEQKCMEGEANWLHFATMYDRLLILKNRPQRYGTQYRNINEKEEKYELFPLENPQWVNEWRERLGLPILGAF